jgi:hypothetical protein
MRARLATETPRHKLTHDLAAAYQDAHDLPQEFWRELYKDAELAIRMGATGTRRAL